MSLGFALVVSDTSWLTGERTPVLAGLAVLTTVLSVQAGEVNDRLFGSSSVMGVFAVGFYVLAPSTPSAPTSALAVALAPMMIVSVLGFYTKGDWTERNWHRAAFNFGQLAVVGLAASTVAAFIVEWLTPSDFVPGSTDRELVVPFVVAGLVAPIAYALVNLAAVSVAVRALHGRRAVLPWSGLWSIVLSVVALGAIGSFVGVVFARSSNPAVIPLTLIVFVIGQMVFTSWARLRTAHEDAISGFVKTLEARDLYTRGHTEKVAEFCWLAGEELGLSENRIEHLRWAALIHDVGKMAVSSDLMRSPEEFGDEERLAFHTATHQVDDLLSDVAFLRPMVEIASGFHPTQFGVEYGQVGHRHDQSEPTIEQCVLAVADAFDAMTSSRSYRMAISQRAAFDQLRQSEDRLYSDEAIDALEEGLRKEAREYGPPDLAMDQAGVRRG